MSIESGIANSPENEPHIIERYEEENLNLESSIPVELRCNIFGIETNSQIDYTKVVVFLPGWAMNVRDSAVKPICKTYTLESLCPTLAIQTRSLVADDKEGGNDYDFLFEEARAIVHFLINKGVRSVIVAGHSQGADKAINVASYLIQNTEISIDGVVLLGAVGLYDQRPSGLTLSFIHDFFVEAPRALFGSSALWKGKKLKIFFYDLWVQLKVLFNLIGEVLTSNLKYIRRLKREIEEMALENVRTHDITAPIIIVSSDDDLVSKPENIIPAQDVDRVEYLKKNVFTSSRAIRIFTPHKMAHYKLLFTRPETIARATIHILKELL